MKLNVLAITLLGLAIPVMGQSAPDTQPTPLRQTTDNPAVTPKDEPKDSPKDEPKEAAKEAVKEAAPVAPAPPVPPAGIPLTPREQDELRLAAAKLQVKTFKNQLKAAKKSDSSVVDKELKKIRQNHGWDETYQIQDRGSSIVGVKQ